MGLCSSSKNTTYNRTTVYKPGHDSKAWQSLQRNVEKTKNNPNALKDVNFKFDENAWQFDEGEWKTRTGIIAETGTTKLRYGQWHFVTSDSKSHFVILSCSQDIKTNKIKTRRSLAVDGFIKYNEISTQSSFPIDINGDKIVVAVHRIKTYDSYKYSFSLTINNKSFMDAFKIWQNK